MSQIAQDSIDFTLAAEETVINDTVKIIAFLSAIVTPGLTEDDLKRRIRGMMQRFIADASWSFTSIVRQNHASGMEEVTLQASTRVSEKENFGLEKRSRDVSEEGLSITEVQTDTSPPAFMVEECESKLRVILLGKAQKDLALINKALGQQYRLGQVSFQAVNAGNTSNRASNKVIAASSYGSGFTDEADLGNAVKLVMRASVSLRRIAVIAGGSTGAAVS